MEIESEDDGKMMESSGKSRKMAMIGGADLIPASFQEELLVRFRCVCKSPCFISSHAQLLAAVHHIRSDSDSFSGFGSDDSDSDSESDSDSDSGSEFDVDSGNDADSDSDHNSDADSDNISDSEAEADPGAEADSDADSDNISDSEAEADPGAEADSDYDADVDSDDDENPLALAMAILKDETLAREYINDTQRWCPITHQIHIIVPIGTLWNPIARVNFRKLFKPNFRFPIIRPHAHPFGFDLESLDSLTKDYNTVVWVPTFWRRDLALYNTLANESWRQIQYPYVLAWWRCTGNFDGSLYWLGGKFSVGREVFREVPALHNVQARSSGHYHFVQNENSIAFRLAMEYREPPHSIGSVHGWVMKQEGHWNKHFTLGLDNTRVRFRYPLGFWKKEEELFVGTTIKNKLVFKYKESLVQSRDYKWRRTGTGTGIDCAPKPRLLRPQHVISFGISLIHEMRIRCRKVEDPLMGEEMDIID